MDCIFDINDVLPDFDKENDNCNNYDLEQIGKIIDMDKKFKYGVMHINIHSLPSKIDDLKDIVQSLLVHN